MLSIMMWPTETHGYETRIDQETPVVQQDGGSLTLRCRADPPRPEQFREVELVVNRRLAYETSNRTLDEANALRKLCCYTHTCAVTPRSGLCEILLARHLRRQRLYDLPLLSRSPTMRPCV
ncbi:hypothetical protein CHU98_g2304 [Xylaria longipes]|nr:hypothetical protein CHU98_g2304 [Xylaria longipes]